MHFVVEKHEKMGLKGLILVQHAGRITERLGSDRRRPIYGNNLR